MDQIWPCRKIGQGQPRVIIWTHLVALEYPMLHIKFQGYRPFDSGDDFKVFTIYGHGGHLGHVTWTIWTNFRFPVPRRLHMKFGFNRLSGFRGDVWKYWHTHNTYSCYRFTAAFKCRDAAKIYPTSVLYPQFRFFVRDEHKWAASWQNKQNDCAPSKDSDQPGHLPSLIRVFAVRSMGTFLHADSEDSDQTGRMPRLIWVFAGRKIHFVGFLMRRLKLMLVSVRHIYQTSFENNLFSIDFSIEHTGSIQIHSTFWIFKMSSAIDSPCSGIKN